MELGHGVAGHVDAGSLRHHPREVLLSEMASGSFFDLCFTFIPSGK